MWSSKINPGAALAVCVFLLQMLESHAMTRQQLKNSGKLMKKTCMPKNDVTEEEVGSIEQGKFIEDRRVMCYVACVYTITQVIKNNKLSYEAVIKQVDMMFPPEMRTAVKAAAENCKEIAKKYKDDICEASYRTAKCMYEYDAENFVFP
uniref:Odorant-binding protein 13 n=1 Tax=Ectropis obliqua TaxID=248899 RepID=A0A1L2BLC6_ECTOB|nr:odorant-binding protein 13 [Ectropis obliqua]